MKNKTFVYLFVMLGSLFLLATACKKDTDDTDTPDPTTVTDFEGNVYNTVTIGTQVWMKENLKVTHYRDGSSIPNVTEAAPWQAQTAGAYCNYDNDANNGSTYGRLYNWYAVNDSRGLAPAGWHIPSEAEWNTMVSYLGGEEVAGGKLKETGATHWTIINIGATNETGFTAIPGGERSYNGVFNKLNEAATWWTSSSDGTYAWQWIVGAYDDDIGEQGSIYTYGFSVRCVKD